MSTGMEYIIAYLHDILIKSDNKVQEKTARIRAVFQRVEKYAFQFGTDKCEFFMKKKYSGLIIDSNGI